jgi:hypothetical protein
VPSVAVDANGVIKGRPAAGVQGKNMNDFSAYEHTGVHKN